MKYLISYINARGFFAHCITGDLETTSASIVEIGADVGSSYGLIISLSRLDEEEFELLDRAGVPIYEDQ